MEGETMTEANAPLDPDVYPDIPPDEPLEDEEVEYAAGPGCVTDTDEAPYFDPSRGAGGPDRYRYGKVPSTVLTVVTETTERPYVCCGYCSAQMAAITARSGVSSDMKREGHAIRSRGGRPHNAGSNATELRTGLDRALDVDVDSIAKGSILGRLRSGYAVTVSLDYADLPEQVKVQGGSFGHTVCLFGYRRDGDRDMVGYFDPLWPQGSQGAWVRWADIDQALWSSGHNTTKTRYTPPPPVRYTHGGTRHDHVYRVRGDHTNVRTSPRMADNVHHQLDSGETFHAYQKTTQGSRVAGSTLWYGGKDGDRWVHSSVVR
jgi:hypothetical protein